MSFPIDGQTVHTPIPGQSGPGPVDHERSKDANLQAAAEEARKMGPDRTAAAIERLTTPRISTFPLTETQARVVDAVRVPIAAALDVGEAVAMAPLVAKDLADAAVHGIISGLEKKPT